MVGVPKSYVSSIEHMPDRACRRESIMSALAWHPPMERAAPQAPPRARLTVLPPFTEAPRPNRPSRRRLRITRRGRLLLTLLGFGAVSLLALVVAARLAAPLPIPEHVTVIRPGETLSHIALEEMPRLPMEVAVARIQAANSLNSPALVEGQSLVIPAS